MKFKVTNRYFNKNLSNKLKYKFYMNERILIVILINLTQKKIKTIKNVRFDFYSLDILIHVAHVQSCSR